MKLRNFLMFYFFYKSCNKTLHSSRGPIVIWSHSQCTTEDAHVQSCIIIPIRKCSSLSWHHLCHQLNANAFDCLCAPPLGGARELSSLYTTHHLLPLHACALARVETTVLRWCMNDCGFWPLGLHHIPTKLCTIPNIIQTKMFWRHICVQDTPRQTVIFQITFQKIIILK